MQIFTSMLACRSPSLLMYSTCKRTRGDANSYTCRHMISVETGTAGFLCGSQLVIAQQ